MPTVLYYGGEGMFRLGDRTNVLCPRVLELDRQENTFRYILMNQMELPKRVRWRYNEGNLTKE